MKIISALPLIALLAIFTTPVNAQPGYYKVTEALTKHLNVREEPSSTSKDIGDLAPGPQPFEIMETDPTGEWGRILWLDATGWVAMEFMAPVQVPHLADTIVPIGLLCAGTKPFWTIEIESAEAATLSTSEAVTPMALSTVKVSRNRQDHPVAIELFAADYNAVTLLSRQACSDGLSDINYSWAADIIIQPNLSLLSGCCVMR